MLRYYVTVDGQQQGPSTIAGLKEAYTRGSTNSQCLCWNENLPNWQLISEVPGLMASLQPAPAPKPTPPKPPVPTPAPAPAAQPAPTPVAAAARQSSHHACMHSFSVHDCEMRLVTTRVTVC